MTKEMKTYPSRLDTLDLGKWGTLKFFQWLFNERESPPLTEAWVDSVSGIIPAGSFVVDIGAFTGDTALPYALVAGPKGHVLAFEPGPTSIEFLRKNVEINKDNPRLAPVAIAPHAVMAKPGTCRFHYVDDGFINGGFSSGLDAGPAGCGNTHPVDVSAVSLTRYLIKHCFGWIPKLAFVKIDTEGYDAKILTANAALFREIKPLIQIEVYPFLSDRERVDLMLSVEQIGYCWDGGKSVFLHPDPRPKDVLCRPK